MNRSVSAELVRGLVHDGSTIAVAPLAEAPAGLPPAWASLLQSHDPWPDLLRLWVPFKSRLWRTIVAMSRRLHGVGLRTGADGAPALLYFFKKGEQISCYQGNAPRPVRELLPKDVAEFHEVLHDGWALMHGRSEGLLSSSEWYRLSSVLDRPDATPERLGFDPKDLVIVSDLLGGISSLGFDVSKNPAVCWKWSKDLPPEMTADFWAVLDKAVAGTLEQLDPTA